MPFTVPPVLKARIDGLTVRERILLAAGAAAIIALPDGSHRLVRVGRGNTYDLGRTFSLGLTMSL